MTGECAIEVLPTIGNIEPNHEFEVVDDSDIVHARKRREAVERFFPKDGVGLVGLWPDCERFQGPFLSEMIHKRFD